MELFVNVKEHLFKGGHRDTVALNLQLFQTLIQFFKEGLKVLCLIPWNHIGNLASVLS
jgi:hypothetical protein